MEPLQTQNPSSPGVPDQGQNPSNMPGTQYPSPSIPNQIQDPNDVPGTQNASPGIPNQSLNPTPGPVQGQNFSNETQSLGAPNQGRSPSNVPGPQGESPGVPNQGLEPSKAPGSNAPQALSTSADPAPDTQSNNKGINVEPSSPGVTDQDQNPSNLLGPQYPSPSIPSQIQDPNNVSGTQNSAPGIPNQSLNPTSGLAQGQNSSNEAQSPGVPNQDEKPSNVPGPQGESPSVPNRGLEPSKVPGSNAPQDLNTFAGPDPDTQSIKSGGKPGINVEPGVSEQGQNPSNVPSPQFPSPSVPNQIQDPNNVPGTQNASPGIPNQSLNPTSGPVQGQNSSNVSGTQAQSPGVSNQDRNPSNAPGPQGQTTGVPNQGRNPSNAPGSNAPQDPSTSAGLDPETPSIKSGGKPGINVELHGRVTKYMVFSVIAAILGMFQFGYNAGAVNQPREFIEAFILMQQPPDEQSSDAGTMFSVIVGIFAIGGMVGSPIAAFLCHKFGRKEILIGNAAFGIFGSLLMALCKEANSVEMLIIGRLLNGINCGIASTVCPMYVSEIAPVNLRGAFGAGNQLAVAIGVTFGQVLGIDAILGSDDTWPILFGLVAVPALIQFIMLFFVPKSPRYLLLVLRDEGRAKNVLCKLRGTPDIDEEIRAMNVEDRLEKEAGQFGVLHLCKHRHLLRPLIIGIVLHFSHQWGGINVLLNFSTTIFEDATLSPNQARLASIGVGLVLILNVFISIFMIDHFGRRKLELAGLGGMAFFSALMTIGLNIEDFTVNVMTVVFALCYIASFGIGPGTIPWMLMSEMFTQSARSTAVSIGATVNWFANFVIGISFVTLRDGFATYVFLPFTFLLIFFIIFVYFFLPETRHRTHEQMHHHFKDGIELPGGFIL